MSSSSSGRTVYENFFDAVNIPDGTYTIDLPVADHTHTLIFAHYSLGSATAFSLDLESRYEDYGDWYKGTRGQDQGHGSLPIRFGPIANPITGFQMGSPGHGTGLVMGTVSAGYKPFGVDRQEITYPLPIFGLHSFRYRVTVDGGGPLATLQLTAVLMRYPLT
ncbi:MAG: hypothetical protein U1E76_18420 [Planctomycetota bacterium]